MIFKKQKASTPSMRHSFLLLKNLQKKPLLKKSLTSCRKALGKTSSGKIISRHKEIGAKKRYRKLDLKRTSVDEGVVCSIEHDPYRSGFIMAVFSTTRKKFFYTLAPEGISVGDSIKSGKTLDIKAGNSVRLNRVPPGAMISNIPLRKEGLGKIARSAGSYCLVRGHTEYFTFLELMSGEVRLVESGTHVMIGRVSNEYHFLEQSGKAGRSRWLGKRPVTRGVAMNPVDHPNGGGEGKKSGPGKTPWGRSSKRGKTFKHKNNKFIIKRRYE